MATSDARLSIGAVTLLTKNRSEVASFYQNVVGLNVISEGDDTLTLGQGDNPLLHLRENSSAKRRPTEAGLFHTAFVLPAREDLGAWVLHATELGVKLDGAADHLVSEALYLQDPEGNGIEIYVDRDRTEWTTDHSGIKLATLPLDLKKLVESSVEPWQSVPQGSVIGHVHLQVGNIDVADGFYRDEIGFPLTVQMSGASFYGAGGYHHHIGANIWNSRNADRRSEDSTGLLQIDLLTTVEESVKQTYRDPWGIAVTVSNKHAN